MNWITGFRDECAKHLTVMDLLICFLLAVACNYASAYWKVPSAAHQSLIFLWVFLSFIVFVLGVLIFRKILDAGAKDKNKVVFSSVFNSKYSYWYCAGIIFCVYLIAAIFLYPGTLSNDTWGQLQSSLQLANGTWNMSALHPILDTFIYSVIIIPLVKSLGWQGAIFIYVLIQSAVYSLTFAYTLRYAQKVLGLSNRVLTAFLAIYCLVLPYALITQSLSNDAISGWLLILFLVKVIEIVRTQGNSLQNHKELLQFLLIVVFCCMTKKIEVYVLLVSLIVLFFLIQKKKGVFAGIVALIITAFIFLPAVNTALSIKADAPSEMLNVPYQMTAAYVKEYPNDVTAEEKAAINKVLDYSTLAEKYNPTNGDTIRKPRYEGFGDYFKAWFSMGLRHPDAYVRAIGEHEAGWFSFSLYKPPTDMNWHSQLNPQLIPDDVPMRNNLAYETESMVETVYSAFYKVPILGMTLTYAFWTVLMPLLVLCTMIRSCWRSRKKVRKYYASRHGVYRAVRSIGNQKPNIYWIIALPLILSFLMGCLPAAVSVHIEGVWYVYPLVLLLPITLMGCFFMRKQQISEDTE